jgi:excisionase family DNA binding protein
MRYTLGEAAKATGKSKTTVQRAIAKGKISAEKLGNGYSIDPSELHRVFPMQRNDTVSRNTKVDPLRPDETPDSVSVLRVRIEALETLLSREQEVTSDLREDRDKWRQQATALLEDHRPKGFFKRLLGG